MYTFCVSDFVGQIIRINKKFDQNKVTKLICKLIVEVWNQTSGGHMSVWNFAEWLKNSTKPMRTAKIGNDS